MGPTRQIVACVCERERKRKRETERQRDREKEQNCVKEGERKKCSLSRALFASVGHENIQTITKDD